MGYIKAFWVAVCILLATQVISQESNQNDLLPNYLEIKDALVTDKFEKAITASKELRSILITKTDEGMTASEKSTWNTQKNNMLKSTTGIIEAGDIEMARNHFKDLSVSLYEVLTTFKHTEVSWFYQYCPMKKAYWISTEKDIKNPYYGKKMLTCGSVKESF